MEPMEPMEPMELLNVPQGDFSLDRYPTPSHPSLRAWDAADELLLHHLHELAPELPERPTCWIFNDSFGALATALSQWQPQVVSDSFLSQQGTRANLQKNGLSIEAVRLLNSLETPTGHPQLVIFKVPKTLAILEHQLLQIQPLLGPDTRVVGAGMVKHIHRSTLALCERITGSTTTSLARKKARLIHVTPDLTRPRQQSPYPVCYRLEGSDYEISNHASVFSREKLDIGTRLLLQQIPEIPETRDIIDLGCGNGVVGLIAADRNPQAHIHFVDESWMAVESARLNFQTAFGNERMASFQFGNCLDQFPPQSADLILNNPPFHQQQVVGDHIAWQMFRQSEKTLRPGGVLLVIGNRHLGYHAKLKKLFGNCKTVASNAKFVVLRARKRS